MQDSSLGMHITRDQVVQRSSLGNSILVLIKLIKRQRYHADGDFG